MTNFPSPSDCTNGMKYSLTSGVRVPNSVTEYDMSQEIKYFLCKTAEPNV
jgi:hypothetical protein